MSKTNNNRLSPNEAMKSCIKGERMISNTEKYENYKEQFQRLKRAMDNKFYLEAVFIEYAIMEDRTKSILSHAGIEKIPCNISQKIDKIEKLALQTPLIGRYFAKDLKGKINLMDEIKGWLKARNALIHKLVNIITTTEGLSEIAEQGQRLCKDLNSRASNYKQMLERRKLQQEKQ